ncbi:MAG: WD40 repeat domain-containing serine/threonine-protein kinase [Candidatus Eremiobacteraeota bacterium]|nr:WD40 repeat domain-containing serine/threonine-protein kinase [Candidatus Eremiobacteraeota bacterium]
MNCPYCQTPQKDAAKFCNHCGASLESGELKKGSLIDNRYEIVSLVGKGGMGALYKVKDHRLMDTHYALKEMLDNFSDPRERADAISWFKREAEILCRELRHPNIPVVKDFFIEKGRYYLVMDFIEGHDADSLTLPLAEKDALEFAKTAIDIIEYLHGKKVIHRDIKPENFLKEKATGKLFLVDFGTATVFSRGRTKTAIGTEGYASPEHYEGKADERSDLYSLGATLHRLVTGADPKVRPPFAFEPVRKLNGKISEDFARIIEKAIQYKPENRYQSASEMEKDIRALIEKREKGQTPAAALQAAAPSPAALVTHLMAQPPAALFAGDSLFIRAHRGIANAVAFSPEAESLATGGSDNAVRLFSLSSGTELQAWQEHYSEVTSVAFSPDGAFIASGSGDTSVKVRRAVPGERTVSLAGHAGKVMRVLFSPGGTLLVSCAADMMIIVWDAKTWTKKVILDEHRSWKDISFSRTGKALAAVSADGTLTLFNMKTWQFLLKIEAGFDVVHSCAYSPLDNFVACGMEDGSVVLCDTQQGKAARTLKGHQGSVFSLAFAPDGMSLLSGSRDKTARLWDAASGKCLKVIGGHGGEVHSVAFSRDGSLCATACADSIVRIWKVPSLTAAPPQKPPAPQATPAAAAAPSASPPAPASASPPAPPSAPQPAVSPATTQAPAPETAPAEPPAAAGTEKSTPPAPPKAPGAPGKPLTVKSMVRTFEGHEGGAQCLAFSRKGRHLAVGTGEGDVALWDIATGNREDIKRTQKSLVDSVGTWIKGAFVGHSANVSAVIFTVLDEYLITASREHYLMVRPRGAGSGEPCMYTYEEEILCADLSKDGARLAAGTKGEILLFAFALGELTEAGSLRKGKDWINGVAISPDGKLLVSGDNGGASWLWDLSSRKELRPLMGHTKKVFSAAFSHDGKEVATSSQDGTIRLWSAATGENRLTIHDPPGNDPHDGIFVVRYAPGGLTIGSAGEDRTAKLWDRTAGRLLVIYEGHTKKINDMAFSPDGKFMATCSDDGTAHLWEVPPSL